MSEAAGAPEGPGPTVPVGLARIVVHATTREPLAVLAEADGDRCLVVAVRGPQAEVMSRGAVPRRAPADELGGREERHPQDLVADVAAALGRRLSRVEITGLVDDRYRSALVLDDGTRVETRPSDALALAVRDALDIAVAASLLDEVGQSVSALLGDAPPPPQEQMAQMRRLLEDVTADDFATGDGPTGPDED